MAGIFPNSGVPANQTLNTVTAATVNCPASLFHSTSLCAPRFDPASANAIISEILSVMNWVSRPYDCSRQDNLARVISDMAGFGVQPGRGTAPPTVAPVTGTSPFFINTTTNPDSLYWWDGTNWNLIGSSLAVVTDTTMYGNGQVGTPLGVAPSLQGGNILTLGADGRLFVPAPPPPAPTGVSLQGGNILVNGADGLPFLSPRLVRVAGGSVLASQLHVGEPGISAAAALAGTTIPYFSVPGYTLSTPTGTTVTVQPEYYIDTGITCTSRAEGGTIGAPRMFHAVISEKRPGFTVNDGNANAYWYWDTKVIALTRWSGPMNFHIRTQPIFGAGGVSTSIPGFDWELWEVIQ